MATSPSNGLLSDGLALAGINVSLWLVSLALGKTWPVDFIWSMWPPLHCARIVSRSTHGCGARQAVVCALVAAWGLRLTLNFVSRGGIGGEDWRYVAMRSQFGAHFWWISLFSVFIGQSVFMFTACLPLYGALLSSAAMLQRADVLGTCVCVAGILLELFADKQMDAFQAAKRRQKTDAVVLDRGLWLRSRHPNYAGEILWWWGAWILSTSSDAPAWVLAGPCGITLLINLVSIPLLEERQLLNKGDEYRAYQRRVPSSLVPIPPFVSEMLEPR